MIRFSVIIPLYNKEPYIARAVESVLNQTLTDFELIVVDDGSTDGGRQRVEQLKDPRIRVIHQENRGGSAARNRGIAEAGADFTAFLDADDAWKPHYLEAIAELIAGHPEAGAYATAYDIVLPGGRVITPKFEAIPPSPWQGVLPSYFRSALGMPPVCSSAVTIPTRIFLELGAFSVGVPLGEDLDMWGRIALKYPIAFSSTIGASYIQEDQHPGSRMNYYGANPEPAFVRSAREAMLRGEAIRGDLKELKEYLAKLQLAVGYDCLVEGRNAAAARKIVWNAAPATLRLRVKKYRVLTQSFLPGALLRVIRRVRRGA